MEVASVTVATESKTAADAQRRSWAERHDFRARQLALGHVRSVAARQPDDASLVADVMAAIVDGQTKGRNHGQAVAS